MLIFQGVGSLLGLHPTIVPLKSLQLGPAQHVQQGGRHTCTNQSDSPPKKTRRLVGATRNEEKLRRRGNVFLNLSPKYETHMRHYTCLHLQHIFVFVYTHFEKQHTGCKEFSLSMKRGRNPRWRCSISEISMK